MKDRNEFYYTGKPKISFTAISYREKILVVAFKTLAKKPHGEILA